MRRTVIIGMLLLGVALLPRSASAEESAPGAEPAVGIAIVAGAATMLVPMVLGVLHTAGQSPEADGPRNVGLAVAGVGPALAPIVAHAVLGEYRRAAVFGAVPVAAEIATCAYVATTPDAVFHGTVASRLGFALLFSANVFGAGLGLVDVMMARERAGLTRSRFPDRLGGITVTPRVGRDQRGVVLGGVW